MTLPLDIDNYDDYNPTYTDADSYDDDDDYTTYIDSYDRFYFEYGKHMSREPDFDVQLKTNEKKNKIDLYEHTF